MQKYLFYQILEQAHQAEAEILELQHTISELKAFLNQRQAVGPLNSYQQTNAKNIGRSLSELKKLCNTELLALNTLFNDSLDESQSTQSIYIWIENNEILFNNNQFLSLGIANWLEEYHDFVNRYIIEDYLNNHIKFNRNHLISCFDQLVNILSRNYEKIHRYKRLNEALEEKKKQIIEQEAQIKNQRPFVNILLYPFFAIKINHSLQLKNEIEWIEDQKNKLHQENTPINIDLNTYENSCNQLISRLYLEEQLTFDPIFGKRVSFTVPKQITSMLATFDHDSLKVQNHYSFWNQANFKQMFFFGLTWLIIILSGFMIFELQGLLFTMEHSSLQGMGIHFNINSNKMSEKSNDQTHELMNNQQDQPRSMQLNQSYQKQIQIDQNIYPHPFQIATIPVTKQLPNQIKSIPKNLKNPLFQIDSVPQASNSFKKTEVNVENQNQSNPFDQKRECINDLACQGIERCIQNRCMTVINPSSQSEKKWCDNACAFMVNQDDQDHIIPNKFNKIELYEFLKNSFTECYGIDPNEERAQLCKEQALNDCSHQCIQYDIEHRHEEDPPKTEPLSSILPSLTGWHCMCYEEKGSVEDPKNVITTICRRNIENCISIQDRVLTVTQEHKNNKLIKDSVLYECSYINELYPWRHNRSSYKWWSKSEKEGELQGKGQCLISDSQSIISGQQKIELNRILRQKLFQRKYKENPSYYNDTQIKCLTDNININKIINNIELTHKEINQIKNKCSRFTY